jgi:hypothetical protein
VSVLQHLPPSVSSELSSGNQLKNNFDILGIWNYKTFLAVDDDLQSIDSSTTAFTHQSTHQLDNAISIVPNYKYDYSFYSFFKPSGDFHRFDFLLILHITWIGTYLSSSAIKHAYLTNIPCLASPCGTVSFHTQTSLILTSHCSTAHARLRGLKPAHNILLSPWFIKGMYVYRGKISWLF